MDNDNLPMSAKVLAGIFVLVILFGFIWLLTGPVAFIGPGERGVEVNKGSVTGKVYTEGWYVYDSFAKDIIQFDTRSQVSNVKVTAASQDLQDVTIDITVQYQVDAAKVAEIVKTIGDQKAVEDKIVAPAVQETIKAASAQFPVADIIKERPKVKDIAERLLAERLSNYGVVVQEISFKDISFSDEFTKAIEQKQVAEQKKQQAEYEAAGVVATAKGKAEAQKIEGEALRSNPEVLELRKVERWDGKLPVYMFGSSTPIINLNK